MNHSRWTHSEKIRVGRGPAYSDQPYQKESYQDYFSTFGRDCLSDEMVAQKERRYIQRKHRGVASDEKQKGDVNHLSMKERFAINGKYQYAAVRDDITGQMVFVSTKDLKDGYETATNRQEEPAKVRSG